MTWYFGFELEGFLRGANNELVVPNTTKGAARLPVDSFPGLVELRTEGGKTLSAAVGELLYLKSSPMFDSVSFTGFEETFSAQQLIKIRSLSAGSKEPANYSNIYGKQPRLVGNRTLASFQISFSSVAAEARADLANGVHYPTRYRLFDFRPYIEALDKAYAEEIREAGRTPGWYSVKGNRVEYRSLPNFAHSRKDLLRTLKGIFEC